MLSTKYYSNKQENRVARLLNGKVVPASGGGKFNKGDILINDDFLLECKTSVEPKKSFNIKKEWLEKINEQAFEMGAECGGLIFDFGEDKDYVVLDINIFKKLLNEYMYREC